MHSFTHTDNLSLSIPPVLQGAVEGEVDPEDDPNNQGEDEFDVAEEQHLQHREEEEADIHLNPNHPAIDEELVVREGGREERREGKEVRRQQK